MGFEAFHVHLFCECMLKDGDSGSLSREDSIVSWYVDEMLPLTTDEYHEHMDAHQCIAREVV